MQPIIVTQSLNYIFVLSIVLCLGELENHGCGISQCHLIVSECGCQQGLHVGVSVLWPQSPGKESLGNSLPQHIVSQVSVGMGSYLSW